MTRQSTLMHAAELLEREAMEIRSGSQQSEADLSWVHDYYDLLQTARALRDMAVTTPFEPGCV